MALVTRTEVKDYLQILHSDDDAWIDQQIPMAEEVFLQRCPNVRFTVNSGITELHDGGEEVLFLKRPVTAITSVTPDGGDGVALDPTDWDLDANAGLLYRADRSKWAAGRREWEVVYDAGFASVPQNAKLAVIHLVSLEHKRRSPGMESERIGDWSYKVDPNDAMFKRLIAPYTHDTIY